MTLPAAVGFFLRLGLIFVGVYVILILTPKLAAFIDKRRKNQQPPAPRPERVEDDEISEDTAGQGENNDDKE